MKNTNLEPAVAEFKALNGQVSIDESTGVVECFVAAIGNKDSVGDVVLPGAFNASLKRRKPRVVWGHNWNEPIGKVLEIYEVTSSDLRLPSKMRSGGVGGLYAKVQFNLASERGREAFANVKFFGEEQEWSIGYKTLDAVFEPGQNANLLKEVELYEVSPVLHGANQLTGTISIKADSASKAAGSGPCWPGYKQVGMKKGKNGNMVPNCVPIDSKEEKSALRDPKGGLTAAGRAHFKRTEGANLKPGVKGAANTPEKMRRKGSFLTRFFTNPSGPMKDSKGRPTRLALSASAWGEPVPQDRSDAAKLAAKGRRMLERYANSKKSDESELLEKTAETIFYTTDEIGLYPEIKDLTKNHMNDVYSASIALARPQDSQKIQLAQSLSRHFGGTPRIVFADENIIVTELRRDGVTETLRIPYHNQNGEYMFGTAQAVTAQTVYTPVGGESQLGQVFASAPNSPEKIGCGCDSCGKAMPSWETFKEHNSGKHLFIHSADDIGLFGAINEMLEGKELDIELLDVGLAIKNIENIDDDSYDELIEFIDDFEEKKLGTTLRRVRRSADVFNPNAINGDPKEDNNVQDNTAFERPDPRIRKPRMMPSVPEEVPVPEKVPEPVPEKVPQPTRTPPMPGRPPGREPQRDPQREPAKPLTVPKRQPAYAVTGSMAGSSSKKEKRDAEIYRQRMNGATLQEMADKLNTSREKIRAAEQRHMRRLRASKKPKKNPEIVIPGRPDLTRASDLPRGQLATEQLMDSIRRGMISRLVRETNNEERKKVLTESGLKSKTINDDLQIMLPLASIFEIKSLIDELIDENELTVVANDDGIFIKDSWLMGEKTVQEIADIVVKVTGVRRGASDAKRSVQRNSPQMGYPKTGGLTANSNKYNCMVSGEKRMKPCLGCSNPKGCLSGTMQFKRDKKNGKQ